MTDQPLSEGFGRPPQAHYDPPASMARYLGLLAGTVRMRLLRALAEGPHSVSQLAGRLGVSVPLVSHNLRKLHQAGLVSVQPRHRTRIYRLDGRLAAAHETGVEVIFEMPDGWSLRLTAPEGEKKGS